MVNGPKLLTLHLNAILASMHKFTFETLSTLWRQSIPFATAIIPICGRPPVGSLPSNWQASLPSGRRHLSRVSLWSATATWLESATAPVMFLLLLHCYICLLLLLPLHCCSCLLQYPDISSLKLAKPSISWIYRLPG